MSSESPQITVVLPCFNEEGNLRPLISAIREGLEPIKVDYEIVITDDCSRDNSWCVLKQLASEDKRIRALRFESNAGQSAAMWAGMRAARGAYIFTLDADMQNDPREMPKFWEALKKYDCVCGSRVESRKSGDNFVRVISSRIANGIRNWLSGDTISDSGCCYRAFKRECVENIRFFKGMHRFMPTLIKMEGFNVTEISISTNPRFSGKTNYGVWNRLFASFYDLLAVRWMKKRLIRFKVAETIN